MRFFIPIIMVALSSSIQADESTTKSQVVKNDPECAAYATTIVPEHLNCPEWKIPPLPKRLSVDDFNDPQKRALAKRVESYWRALIDARFETAYTFISPAQQKLISYKMFHEKYRQGQGLWKDIGFISIDCKELLCLVNLQVNIEFHYMRLKHPIKNSSEIKEKWIFDKKDKQWYLIHLF